jgi:hypothetical protein
MFGFNPLNALGCVAAGTCLCCSAQTNTCPKPAVSFFQPCLQLRQEPAPLPAPKALPGQAERSLVKNTSAPALPAKLEVSTASADGLHGSFVRSDEFYLLRAEEPAFDHGVNRFMDQVFRPEEFHVGKYSVSSSITTAIKRKNPLCLLNPIVFQVSW